MKKGVNLKQIATQTLLAASSAENCTLKHTKSPKESLGGEVFLQMIKQIITRTL